MESPECQAMKNLLGKTLKVTLEDGRTAAGALVCVDRLKNLILKDVNEERWVDSSVYKDGNESNGQNDVVVTKRHLSQAMIPGKHLVKVEISQSIYEENVAPIFATSKSEE